MDFNQLGAAATAIVVTAGAFIAVVRWARPRWQRFTDKVEALFESVNGRPAIIDKATGREVDPAVPSLGVRLASLEGAVRDRAQLEARMTAVETVVAEHGQRLTAIESTHQTERIVGKIESAQAWRAVEAIATQPGDIVDDDPDTEL